MMINLTTPLTKDKIKGLKSGDMVTITGTIYTARDAAHKRLKEMLENGETLPIDLKDAVIYYVGPTPAAPGNVIGSAGPTTSSRMDAYAPQLYDLGMSVSIGKGYRTKPVLDAIVRNQGAYMVAIGGAGAYISQCITACKVIAFEDLGAEAIHELQVDHFPATVCIDAKGHNLYE